MDLLFNFLMVIFVIDVVLLIPVIMMQSGSGAEAGMFGSGLTMGTFGAKTSEVLVNATKWLVAIFMVSAFLLGYLQVMRTKSLSPATQDSVQTETTDTAVTTTTIAGTEESEADTTGTTVPATEDGTELDLFTPTTASPQQGVMPIPEL